MNFGWAFALGFLGIQLVTVLLALVALFLPLTGDFARFMHRKRGLVLAVGIVACAWPLIFFALNITETSGLEGYYAKYLVASLAAVLVQVFLYSREDRRWGGSPESRMRMDDFRRDSPRSPVK